MLILASGSVFRKHILAKLGLDFKVQVSNIDESRKAGETPQQLANRLAYEKAHKVAATSNGIIIASDQVATLDSGFKHTDEILRKPNTYENALVQLKKSSGNTVTFFTSLLLLNTNTRNIQTHTAQSKVVFKKLTSRQISNYLKKETPYNCVGGFKSEGLGIVLCESIIAKDPNSLIGLPLIALTDMLLSEGIDVLGAG